jgi:UDP-N-acetylmuramoyl-tripeptide--D-alanyl-D-alanine ligase
LETTRREKTLMVRALPSSGLAVLNGDDPKVSWMAGQTQARVVTFGFGPENHIRAIEPRLDWPHGTRFTLQTPRGNREIMVKLLGRHTLYAILAAVAVGLAEGVEIDRLVQRLEALEPTRGRMQPFWLDNDVCLLRDDFKSSLETIHAALDFFGQIPARRRLVVMGNITEPPGKQGPLYHRVGARVAGAAERVLFVGTNFQAFAKGVRGGGLARENLTNCKRSIHRAVDVLRSELRPGDVVLIKGRIDQRLGRIALALSGAEVRCALKSCKANTLACEDCPMLGKGWNGPDGKIP